MAPLISDIVVHLKARTELGIRRRMAGRAGLGRHRGEQWGGVPHAASAAAKRRAERCDGQRGRRKKEEEPADKPGSVAGSHSSGAYVTARLLRPTRERLRAAGCGSGCDTAPRAPLFGLAPGGVYRAAACCHRRGALLPHLFTLTTCRAAGSAVCFLWHFPWARAPQALPGTLPCGARTFLPPAPGRPGAGARLPGRLPNYHSTPSQPGVPGKTQPPRAASARR